MALQRDVGSVSRTSYSRSCQCQKACNTYPLRTTTLLHQNNREGIVYWVIGSWSLEKAQRYRTLFTFRDRDISCPVAWVSLLRNKPSHCPCNKYFQDMRLQCLILLCYSLEVVLVVPCNDDVVYFQHHSTQLRGQQQLLAFTNQRVNDKMLSHICLELVIAAALE